MFIRISIWSPQTGSINACVSSFHICNCCTCKYQLKLIWKLSRSGQRDRDEWELTRPVVGLLVHAKRMLQDKIFYCVGSHSSCKNSRRPENLRTWMADLGALQLETETEMDMTAARRQRKQPVADLISRREQARRLSAWSQPKGDYRAPFLAIRLLRIIQVHV